MLTVINQVIHGDCLDILPSVPSESVDMVLCDLPYGTTQNKWDTCIDLVQLWAQYKRVCKGAIVLTAAQPFTSVLVMSNLKDFRYQWVWVKNMVTGHLNAKKMPMSKHEDVLVFGRGLYNPQGLVPFNKVYNTGAGKGGNNYGSYGTGYFKEFSNYPNTVLNFDSDKSRLHPTQKPVALWEYLIRTYTNEGDTVLDNCCGSGTTGVACMNTGRNFIQIEQSLEYCEIACKRLNEL